VTTTPSLQGLVVDWGGVLTPPLDTAMAAWAQRDGVDVGHFRDVMLEWVGSRRGDREALAGEVVAPGRGVVLPSPQAVPAPGSDGVLAGIEQAPDAGPAGTSPVHRLERGELDVADFDARLAAALAERGSPVAPQGLTRRMLGDLAALDDSMVGLVARARSAGLRTALLSNSWGNDYPEELTDGLFDVVVISGKVGMRKPEPRIFRHTAELLDLPEGACVMVDDLPHNVRAAAAAGMVGVLHRSYAETLGELETLFGRSLS
jgi:epoxide hydrolase-like predicted phosphatase